MVLTCAFGLILCSFRVYFCLGDFPLPLLHLFLPPILERPGDEMQDKNAPHKEDEKNQGRKKAVHGPKAAHQPVFLINEK